MNPNPFLGVILLLIGGLVSASFYIPFGRVKKWSWETYWLMGGFFSWVIAPWLLAWMMTPKDVSLFALILNAPAGSLAWTCAFGVMWGVGGLTFGLSLRYLGISLGIAVALGLCAAFGTLMPPIVAGKTVELLTTAPGIATLIGVIACLVGIAVTGAAGMSKERELTAEKKQEIIKEFNFPKGILVAVFSGIMSAGMHYGFRAGEPIARSAVDYGVADLWQNLPVLCVILVGGFATNFIWCVALNVKNRSGGEYIDFSQPALWLSNLFFSALAGTLWYVQFFFYSMGETKIGAYKFSSWALFMSSVIIFSSCWGVALREWQGSSRRTFCLLFLGIAVLVLSMVIVAYGNYLKISSGAL